MRFETRLKLLPSPHCRARSSFTHTTTQLVGTGHSRKLMPNPTTQESLCRASAHSQLLWSTLITPNIWREKTSILTRRYNFRSLKLVSMERKFFCISFRFSGTLPFQKSLVSVFSEHSGRLMTDLPPATSSMLLRKLKLVTWPSIAHYKIKNRDSRFNKLLLQHSSEQLLSLLTVLYYPRFEL